MQRVTETELYNRLKKQAYNSSHFVWLWSDLTFIQSSNGWIFGVTKELGVNLIALEPLPPMALPENTELSFSIALTEIKSHFHNGIIAFVGIYSEQARALANFGFQSLQIGKEPWVNLLDIKPTGHAGRKVRVGRNQALKSGLRIEEWKLAEVILEPSKLAAMNEVKQLWEDQSFVSLSGFLHGMSFECIPNDRLCFVALTPNDTIDGILIITPIENGKSWYFEDTLTRANSGASKGIGELLTLSALESLQAAGHREISLGIVPMTSVGICEFGEEPPKNFLRLTRFFQSSMKLFYNAEGMELFRKRFKVYKWDKIYLSVLIDPNGSRSKTYQWIKVLAAVTLAYKPKLQLKASYLIGLIFSPLKRFPTTFSFLFFSLISFFMTTKMNLLSGLIEQDLEFSKNVDLWQWPLRTISSEFIYFNSWQFLFLAGLITFILYTIEKEVFDKKWAAYILSFFILNDIIVRSVSGLIYKYITTNESLANLINLFPTHGGWILLASLLGFLITLSGAKKDEWLATSLLMLIVLSFILSIFGISPLLVLYGITFYLGGYLVGKYYLRFQSLRDAQINKKAP